MRAIKMVLLVRADSNTADGYGNTLLTVDAQFNCLEVSKSLLQNRVLVISETLCQCHDICHSMMLLQIQIDMWSRSELMTNVVFHGVFLVACLREDTLLGNIGSSAYMQYLIVYFLDVNKLVAVDTL